MDRLLKRMYQILIFGGIGALLILLAVATPGILDNNDFSMYNAGWNGCSDLAVKTYKSGKLQPTFSFEMTQLTLTPKSFVEYPLVAKNSTILIIGPRSSFSTQEVSYLKDFVKKGGMLLLADDFGTGNELLTKMNTSTRFIGGLLLDLSFEKKAEFVTVYNFSRKSHPLALNATSVVLNYATGLQIKGKNATVIARSSEISWIDKNENQKEDIGEKKGPFPVLVSERYGQGEIIVLSDASLLINSMKDVRGNAAFRERLLLYLFKGRGSVIIDESHRALTTPLHMFYMLPLTIGIEGKAALLLLGVGIFIVGFTPFPHYAARSMLRVFRSKKKPAVSWQQGVVDTVLEKHPSWNRRRVEELISRLKP
jgi:hypothetical protein